MGKIIALASLKGGTGRTTIAAALAFVLAPKSRVLLCDLDPLSGVTKLCLTLPYTPVKDTLSACLKEQRIPAVEKLSDGVDVIRARYYDLKEDLSPVAKEDELDSLRYILLALKRKYDYIIIDTPHYVGRLFGNAVVAADEIITPVTMDRLGVSLITELENTIRAYRIAARQEQVQLRILVNRFSAKRMNDGAFVKPILDIYGDRVLPVAIREDAKVMSAQLLAGRPKLYGKAVEDLRVLAEKLFNEQPISTEHV